MSKSIMEPVGACECWNCGDTRNLEVHHIFYGIRARKKSEHYGLKVHLCPGCHPAGGGGLPQAECPHGPISWGAVLILAGLLLCTAYLVDGTYNPFLYFRF